MPFYRTQKFNKEIRMLGYLKQRKLLHPLLQEQIKQNILQRIASETTTVAKLFFWQDTRRISLRYSMAVLGGLMLMGGTVFASRNTHLGDTLFPVKQTKEKVELSLAISDQNKAAILAKHAHERIREYRELKMHAINSDASSGVKDQLDDLEKRAQTHAQVDVQNALSALTEVKTNLESQGNTTTVAILDERIKDLQDKAKEAKISINSNSKELEKDETEERHEQDRENYKKEEERRLEEEKRRLEKVRQEQEKEREKERKNKKEDSPTNVQERTD